MIDKKKYTKAWQERVGETTAHIKLDKDYLPKKPLYAFYKKAVGDFDFDHKKVIDIGCGGGIFAEWILNRYNCDYTGVDIAERSCKAAVDRIGDRGDIFYESDPVNVLEILRKEFDVAVCLNVIQHIPDQDYFQIFFNYLRISKIKHIIIQYKHNNMTLFQKEPYKTTNEINLACYTCEKDIMGIMDNYKIVSKKKSGENMFLILELV